MRVLLLTTHVNMGGITRYLLTLAKGLIRSGHDVHLISSGGEMEDGFRQLGVHTTMLDIRVKSTLHPKIFFALKPVAEYIRQHKIELLHAQTRVTQVMGHLLQRRCGIPYVSTCHGYFKSKLSRRLWPSWGQVIAISQAVYDHLKDDHHVNESSIHLIKSGIELERFPEVGLTQKIALRRQLGVKDEPLIGMVARLSDVKGQDIAIKAMPRIIQTVPSAKLLLFGEGKMKAELLRLTDQLKLTDHIRFYPIVDQTYECLSLLNICVVPSRQEGLGLSVMEAQACGVAVVGSRVGGIVSLIQDGVTGILVAPEDSEALAEAVIALLQDEHKRQGIGLAARAYALAHYDASVMVKATIDVYEHSIRQRQKDTGR